MKFTAALSIVLLASSEAFAPSASFVRSSSSLQAEGSSSRGEFLAQMAGLVAVSTAFPGSAQAAKYGSIGAGSAGVLDPKDAIIDDEVFKTEAVQSALKNVKNYAAMVSDMKNSLASNSQVNLGPMIRKEFDFVKLRSDLNTFNSAFDEETQRGTDRLVRVIMQDLTELEKANEQKDGIERSERRVGNINAKLDKLSKAFTDIIAFAP
mmetsp:Transcript_133462/g.386307  ORF Transcript_133462/g.386307 Transcript_133462/m.386307 type:complete len:208 (+) Transcript_133462:143-766(+)|eukprot:CAMPEP_0176016594 /NCGR_PEP_ID=MMETSP0120_2-20121206/7932_1 /TAXON_ID=160619 /ORGANISM="Kryptoperidinium foliaceum, Strain CCMP 1326" /LENGTH=207 /DNA_ID=CAMNT_0017349597 /DNA_START=83 /DNA_END=706 /DNA_ORIENTATION=-